MLKRYTWIDKIWYLHVAEVTPDEKDITDAENEKLFMINGLPGYYIYNKKKDTIYKGIQLQKDNITTQEELSKLQNELQEINQKAVRLQQEEGKENELKEVYTREQEILKEMAEKYTPFTYYEYEIYIGDENKPIQEYLLPLI